MAERGSQHLVEALKEKAVVLETGLSGKEITRVEHAHGFRFPKVYREFLTIALPVNRGFPNWRSESETSLRAKMVGICGEVIVPAERVHRGDLLAFSIRDLPEFRRDARRLLGVQFARDWAYPLNANAAPHRSERLSIVGR